MKAMKMTKTSSHKSGKSVSTPGLKPVVEELDDINNLVDSPNLRPDLGVIEENNNNLGDSFFRGVSPGLSKSGKRGRGFNRMTTDQFNEQKDLIEMQKSMKSIRRESILRIPVMNAREKENIRGRIFTNEDITQAKARITLRQAGKTFDRTAQQLRRVESIVGHYNDDVDQMVQRLHKRAEQVKPMKPKAPSLRTMQRSRERSRPTNWNIDTREKYCNFNKLSVENFQASLPRDAVKHSIPFRLYGGGGQKRIFEISIHEPDMFGTGTRAASPERTKLRERPLSAAPRLKVRKTKKPALKVFKNQRDQQHHVEHMVAKEYGSNLVAKCQCCQQGEVKHYWPEKKRLKICKRLPNSTLKRLYGSRASLLAESCAASKRSTRPTSAFPPAPADLKF